jgi:hypothetical protein
MALEALLAVPPYSIIVSNLAFAGIQEEYTVSHSSLRLLKLLL